MDSLFGMLRPVIIAPGFEDTVSIRSPSLTCQLLTPEPSLNRNIFDPSSSYEDRRLPSRQIHQSNLQIPKRHSQLI